MRVAVTTAAMLLVSLPAFAQDEAARRAATEVAARVPFEKVIKGAPYTADTVIEGTQTLADGNRINRKTTGRVYRDGEGRSRREEDRPNGTTSVSIVDPVGGSSYSLDPVNKIAWRTPIGVGGAIMGKLEEAKAAKKEADLTSLKRELEEKVNAQGQPEVGFRSVPLTEEEKQKVEEKARAARIAGATDAQSRAAQVEQEKEKVEAARAGGVGGGGRGGARGGGAGGGGRGGMIARSSGPVPIVTVERKTLEGIAVEGRKTTSVIPAGDIGNEQPITIVSEEWRSPDLNVLVMTRHADPRSGESIYRLTNIIRAEPDPSLFMVPSDYTVKDTGIRKMLEASIRR